MDNAEHIRQEAADYGADVVDWDFKDTRIKGLYCDNVIAVSNRLDQKCRAAVLAEELGHHLTATGNILDQRDTANRKQELQGRVWAYNRLIGLTGLLKAYRSGCRNRYDIAELLDVPEDFLQEAVEYYHKKYGLFTQVDNYVIYFEPLGVMEIV